VELYAESPMRPYVMHVCYFDFMYTAVSNSECVFFSLISAKHYVKIRFHGFFFCFGLIPYKS